MQGVIYRNRVNFSRWLIIGGVAALAVFLLGFVTGEIGPMFFGIGGLWLAVIAFIAIIIQVAGGQQVAQLSLEPPTLVVEANGLFGQGRRQIMPLNEIGNWRWLTQSSNSRQIGPKLGMLAFEHGSKTYRLPLTTAHAADIEALRQLAPDAMEALLAKFPHLASLPKP